MDNGKIVSQLDENGFYVGEAIADGSPLEAGVFLIPRLCVDVAALPHVDGKRQQFIAGAFHYVDIPMDHEPKMPTLEELKAGRIAILNSECQGLANQLTAGYPEFEKLTWEEQRREAVAWQADSNVPTPYIDGLAIERGIDRVDFLGRTLAKVMAFSAAAQKLVGQRQKFEDQIKAAASPEALAAIKPIFKLE